MSFGKSVSIILHCFLCSTVNCFGCNNDIPVVKMLTLNDSPFSECLGIVVRDRFTFMSSELLLTEFCGDVCHYEHSYDRALCVNFH